MTTPTYPVEHTIAEHDERSSAGDALVICTVLILLSLWAGYELGVERTQDAHAAAKVPAQCPASDTHRDVIEHTWSHRGQVFYRECLGVARPFAFPPEASAKNSHAM